MCASAEADTQRQSFLCSQFNTLGDTASACEDPQKYGSEQLRAYLGARNVTPEELNIERAIENMYDVMWGINPAPKPKIQIGPLDC